MLKQNRITHDHWWNEGFKGHPERKIPWRDNYTKFDEFNWFLSIKKISLTKGGPKWLMSYNSALVRIDDIKLLVCNESFSIIDIPLEMRDTLINLSLGLRDRLSHLLGHQFCVFSFIFLQDLLQIS